MIRAEGTQQFEVATGDECLPDGTVESRAVEVQGALNGLLQIRRLMNAHLDAPEAVPAEWERQQPVRAVALILEAAGVLPSSVDTNGVRITTGYRVHRPEPGGTGPVRVEWVGPHGSGAVYEQQQKLRRCAEALGDRGWPVLEYRGARRQRYLEAEPAAAVTGGESRP